MGDGRCLVWLVSFRVGLVHSLSHPLAAAGSLTYPAGSLYIPVTLYINYFAHHAHFSENAVTVLFASNFLDQIFSCSVHPSSRCHLNFRELEIFIGFYVSNCGWCRVQEECRSRPKFKHVRAKTRMAGEGFFRT